MSTKRDTNSNRNSKQFLDKTVVAYIRTWPLGSTPDDMKKGKFWSADQIDAEKISILNISFARIRNKTELYIPGLEKAEDGMAPFTRLWQEISDLQNRNPDLRINLSVGGWGADGFSQLALEKESRASFIKNICTWIEKYNFDGADIDWEYPVNGGWGAIKSDPADKENFTSLMRELRDALNTLEQRTNKDYQISFAAEVSPEYLTWTEPKKLAEITDYIKLMCYDFYGPWTETTGHNANLYTNSLNPEGKSVDGVINNFINAGYSEDKILMGLPLYGRAWNGVKNIDNGIYQGFKEGLNYDGITLPDIKKLMKDPSMKQYWDDEAKASYLYNGDVWVSYEDERAIGEKMKYLKEKGLKGIMLWEYTHDLECELIDSIYNGLKKEK